MTVLTDALVVLSTLCIVFVFGWWFFENYIFKNYECRNYIIQTVFATAFTISCSMFELILFEIFDVLGRQSRLVNWKVDIVVMLCLVVGILPLGFFYSTWNRPWRSRTRVWILALLSWTVYGWAFTRISAVLPITKGELAPFSLEQYISRVGVLGVTIIAGLSGVGAVDFPYTNVSFFMKDFSEEHVRGMEKRLHRTLELIAKKKHRIAVFEYQRRTSYGQSTSQEDGSLLHRAFGFVSGKLRSSSPDIRLGNLRTEVTGLESVAQQIFEDITTARMEQERIRFSRTPRGRLFNLMGYFFSVYCIYKMLVSLINIVFMRENKMDPVSRAIQLFRQYLGGSDVIADSDVPFWVQYISFFFVGVMMVSSVRGLLLRMMQWSQDVYATGSDWSNVMVYTMSWIMGMYFLSSVLLMRMSLPLQYRKVITMVLGKIRFRFYHFWLDVIFLVSAVSRILVLYAVRKQHSSKEKMYLE